MIIKESQIRSEEKVPITLYLSRDNALRLQELAFINNHPQSDIVEALVLYLHSSYQLRNVQFIWSKLYDRLSKEGKDEQERARDIKGGYAGPKDGTLL